MTIHELQTVSELIGRDAERKIAARIMTKHTVTAVNYFNGERKHETSHHISTLAGLKRIASPAGDGWGKRLVMDEAAAREFGAYETTSGQWVINAADFQAFVEIA